MICNTCGEKVREDAVACPNCGFNPKDKKHVVKNKEEKKDDKKTAKVNSVSTEKLSVLWGVLGFFIPIAGLVLFIVWNKDRKKEATAAGIGALIRVVFWIFSFFMTYAFRYFVK